MRQFHLFEWQSLPYGEGAGSIPPDMADRLAAAARRSSLAGKDGNGVLYHGRNALTAGQIVGVVVAEGCSLEILPKIDFDGVDGSEGQVRKRLVHMLATVLDMEIDVGSVTGLGWQQENLLEILIGVFAGKLSDALRQGMPRKYVTHEDDLPVLRGRLDFKRQFSTLAASPDRLACRYDALSPDIVLNQVMKAAIAKLARISVLPENQRRLGELAFIYADVREVPASALEWGKLILDRTNRRWTQLVDLARLLLGSRFQNTSTGSMNGFSLLFEMNVLFEAYIARIAARAFAGTGFRVQAQGGRRYCLQDVETEKSRFMTKPDIIIRRDDDVVCILDTKWKRLANEIDDSKQGISQGDVYQMMAYGMIYRCDNLLLLYPHHHKLDKREGIMSRNQINGVNAKLSVATVDISTDGRLVENLVAVCAV